MLDPKACILGAALALAPVAAAVAQEWDDSGDWTGAYAGGSITRLKFDISNGGMMNLDGVKGTYGLHAGYAHDFGRLVTAVELELDKSDADLDALGKLDNSVRLRALFGYDLNRFLPYLAVGYGWGDIADGPVSSADGPLYGLGISYKLSDTITVGAEFTRYEFDGGRGLDGSAETLAMRIQYRF